MSRHKSHRDENGNTVSAHPKSTAPGLAALGMDIGQVQPFPMMLWEELLVAVH